MDSIIARTAGVGLSVLIVRPVWRSKLACSAALIRVLVRVGMAGGYFYALLRMHQ